MTARYPLVRVGADISELPAGDTLLGVTSSGSAEQLRQAVKNSTGAILLKGQAVYISGASGANVLVALSRANAESTSSKTLGLIESNIAVGASGYVITEGTLTDLDTSMALNEGDPIWLSPTTAGGLLYGLNNKPAAPYHMVYLGVVTRKNANNGSIFVKVQNGFELDELHNVAINVPTHGDVLQYDSVTSLWKNDTIAGGAGTTVLAFANFNVTDGELIVEHLSTFNPSIVDGEFIVEYTPL
jgi:hypothetical protein